MNPEANEVGQTKVEDEGRSSDLPPHLLLCFPHTPVIGFIYGLHTYALFHQKKSQRQKSFPQTFFFSRGKHNYTVNQSQVNRETLAAAILFPSKSSTSSGRPSGNETSKMVKTLFPFPIFFSFFSICPGRAAANRLQLAKTHKGASLGKVHSGSIHPSRQTIMLLCSNKQENETTNTAQLTHIPGCAFFSPPAASPRLQHTH